MSLLITNQNRIMSKDHYDHYKKKLLLMKWSLQYHINKMLAMAFGNWQLYMFLQFGPADKPSQQYGLPLNKKKRAM